MKTATQCRTYGTGKLLINEKTYPYLVEIPVAAAGLDVWSDHGVPQIAIHSAKTIIAGALPI